MEMKKTTLRYARLLEAVVLQPTLFASPRRNATLPEGRIAHPYMTEFDSVLQPLKKLKNAACRHVLNDQNLWPSPMLITTLVALIATLMIVANATLNEKHIGFLSKVLEQASLTDDVSEQRTMTDAVVSQVFGNARFGASRNEKMENTMRHMKEFCGGDMQTVFDVLTGKVKMKSVDSRAYLTICEYTGDIAISLSHYNFSKGFPSELGFPQYFTGRKTLLPEYGPLTRELLEIAVCNIYDVERADFEASLDW